MADASETGQRRLDRRGDSRGLKKYTESMWFWPAVAGILLIAVTKGQVLAAVGPLLKFFIPIAGVYIIYRLIKRKIKRALVANLQKTMHEFAETQQHMQREMYQRTQAQQHQTVIEICPRCGEPKKPVCPQCR